MSMIIKACMRRIRANCQLMKGALEETMSLRFKLHGTYRDDSQKKLHNSTCIRRSQVLVFLFSI